MCDFDRDLEKVFLERPPERVILLRRPDPDLFFESLLLLLPLFFERDLDFDLDLDLEGRIPLKDTSLPNSSFFFRSSSFLFIICLTLYLSMSFLLGSFFLSDLSLRRYRSSPLPLPPSLFLSRFLDLSLLCSLTQSIAHLLLHLTTLHI